MSNEKFTLFWRGPLSQWEPSTFTVAGIEFNCAEQFMMYSKAMVFQDILTAYRIIELKSPHEQKKLGRSVANYDPQVWEMFREGIVYTGNYAKFSQSKELYDALMATRGTSLVEASPLDSIWGIGLAEDNPDALDRTKWKGLNLLGEVLTRVREALYYEHNRI